MRLSLSVRLLERADQERAAQRRQWELQRAQARYAARLAQRRYEAVDPEQRLVAGELERRWNVALEQVARLEQTIAQAERTAPVVLSPEERTALDALARDLPAIWHAATTTNRERKQLVRFAITAVQVDRPRPGEGSLQTPVGAVALIRDEAPRHPYHEIAERLNAQGWRTAFGRRFTSQHVGYLCRRYGWARGTCHRQGGSSSAAAQDAAHPGS